MLGQNDIGVAINDFTTAPVIVLDEELDLCIIPWQNFINACNPQGVTVENIYKILRQDYQATYQQTHVSFATKHDLMMFLMSWS
tara:strand:+ start:212 stop:463 length:252 start_codon:yes stop_codon:yes gene_type:complete